MDIETLYLEWLDTSGNRPKTIAEAAKGVRKWLAWRDGRELSLSLLHEFRDEVGGKRWSGRYKNLIIAQIKAMLNWARKRELHPLTSDKICDALGKFQPDKNAPVVLTRDELRRLARACLGCPQTGKTALAIMLTGMRHQEALSIEPQHVTEHGVEVSGANSKNHCGRVVPRFILSDACMKLFDAPLTWNRTQWDKIRERAGLSVQVKALRSTWATYAVSRGVLNPWQSAKTMGHTLAVAEGSYYGAPIFGLEGATTDEWLGVADIIASNPCEDAPESQTKDKVA